MGEEDSEGIQEGGLRGLEQVQVQRWFMTLEGVSIRLQEILEEVV